jgi:hypothetical protein
VAAQAARYGNETTVLEWKKRLVCSRCGAKNIDVVATGERRDLLAPDRPLKPTGTTKQLLGAIYQAARPTAPHLPDLELENREHLKKTVTKALLVAGFVALAASQAQASCSSNQIGDYTYTNCDDGSHSTSNQIGNYSYTDTYNSQGQHTATVRRTRSAATPAPTATNSYRGRATRPSFREFARISATLPPERTAVADLMT